MDRHLQGMQYGDIQRRMYSDGPEVLGVDFDIARCIDIPDATKVLLEGEEIVQISKQLPYYDALDTGVFKVTQGLMEELARRDGAQGVSLSQGVQALAARGDMKAVSVRSAMWIDVDTPMAHAFAEKRLRRFGDALQPTRSTGIPAAQTA